MEAAGIIASAAAAILICLGWLYSLRYIFQYKVENKTLRIKLFGVFTIRRIPLNEIEELKAVPVWLPSSRSPISAIFAEAWPSWVFTRTGVMIRKRTGISRRLILTPERPEEFIRQIQHDIASAPDLGTTRRRERT